MNEIITPEIIDEMPRVRYSEELCQKLLDHCRAGYDIQSFGATINVSRATVYRWIERYPDFKIAHEMGKESLRMRCLKRLHDLADGVLNPRNCSVQAAIYLARVYGIRDDVIERTDENKNKIFIHQIQKPLDRE